jgi:hypothetical protein
VPLTLTELSISSPVLSAIKQPFVTAASPEEGDSCHVLFEDLPLSGLSPYACLARSLALQMASEFRAFSVLL